MQQTNAGLAVNRARKLREITQPTFFQILRLHTGFSTPVDNLITI